MIYYIVNEKVRQNAINEINALRFDTHEVIVRKMKRSGKQNALYWMWISDIARSYPDINEDDLHQSFKAFFLGIEEKTTPFGNKLQQPVSTTGLSKEQFSEYLLRVQAFADEQGIKLTDPSVLGIERLDYENKR